MPSLPAIAGNDRAERRVTNALAAVSRGAKAKERLPGISVLFTSGYTENAIVHGGRLDANVEMLSKPYSREALALKIRQVLARRAQA